MGCFGVGQRNLIRKIMKDNVISIRDRIERWKHIYTSPAGNFKVSVSNMGKLKLEAASKEQICLDFFESVCFMSEVSKGFEEMTLDSIDAI